MARLPVILPILMKNGFVWYLFYKSSPKSLEIKSMVIDLNLSQI